VPKALLGNHGNKLLPDVGTTSSLDKKVTFQKDEYLLVSLEADPNLLVAVAEGPESTPGSSAGSACGTSRACVYLHTTMAYVPCAQLQTKTMRGGLGFCDLLAGPTDLLAASQTLVNPANVFRAVHNSLSLSPSNSNHLTHLKKSTRLRDERSQVQEPMRYFFFFNLPNPSTLTRSWGSLNL
jgi:hypothetical protein